MADKLKVTIIKNKEVYFEGLVISHVNWNAGLYNHPDWYVEFYDNDRGYMYIKQIPDNMQDYEFIFCGV